MIMELRFSALCLLVIFSPTLGYVLQDLGGQWIVDDEAGEYTKLDALVPGGIYTDLLNNGVIEDIFFRYRDTEYRWIPRKNWTYSRTFTVDDDVINSRNVRVNFEGLDTVAKILVNGKEVGDAENMFRQYNFDVKEVLKSGENTIEVRFFNPIEAGEIRNKEFTEGYIIPPECLPTEYNGECYVNQLRKMQASYAWDWGPSFPSVGIWKNVTLLAYNESLIEYVVPDVEDNGDSWIVNVDVYFLDTINAEVSGFLEVQVDEVPDSLRVQKFVLKKNEYDEIVTNIVLNIKKTDVELWWPNGSGKQPLYHLRVIYNNSNESNTQTKISRIGFRTIELIQDEVFAGRLYYFKVNGEPIFMKGANEIPLHILPEKGQEFEITNRILTSVRDANMNMLRIWGGGVYESDIFYDLCDEFGILVWQDYMFASAFYPVRKPFLDNVRLEVRHQTKRLRGHACIAVLCGNNENESNVRGWKAFLEQGDPEQYRADYLTLYIETLKPEVLRITHNRTIFVGSCPNDGIYSDQQNFIAEDPNEWGYGDKHSYIYDKDSFDTTIYPKPRFISEYGLQSYPSMVSLKTITNISEELVFGSDFWHQRDHHPGGEDQIPFLVKLQFNVPQEGSENYTNAIVYYSQVVDGWGMKVASEHYRRLRNYTTNNGYGFTMGALLWQLSDVWVGPSWAGIDSLGRWKIRHYYAKDFFAPVIITGHILDERQLNIYGVSDLLHQELEDLIYNIEVYQWTSFTPVNIQTETTNLKPSRSQLLTIIDTDKYLASYCGGDESKAKNLCFFRLTLNYANGTQVAPENFVFPGKIKDVWLETPNLQITDVSQIDDNTFSIVLETDRISLFIWLESHDIMGRFSENGFHMVTPNKTVTFKSEKPTKLEDLVKVLTVTNIRNDEFK